MTSAGPHLLSIIDQQLSEHNRILIAPMNWGLGHAVRCIPIIKACLQLGKEVYIASDGLALEFLKEEFPQLPYVSLPSYNIVYPTHSMILNLLYQSPHIISTFKKENKEVKNILSLTGCTAIISDNRMGIYHRDTLNIYLTHQIHIAHKIGIVSYGASKIHQAFFKNFDKVWIPDYCGAEALAPKLSHSFDKNVTYLGPLTTIKPQKTTLDWDIVVVLSGPEPQRTQLENQLLKVLSDLTHLNIAFVRGSVSVLHSQKIQKHILIQNKASRKDIEQFYNKTKILIARSGYTTIMDTQLLDIYKIWIPTPGQTEHEYLAEQFSKKPKNINLKLKNINKLKNIIRSLIK